MREALGQQPGDEIEKPRPRFSSEATEGDALELLAQAFDIVGMAMAK